MRIPDICLYKFQLILQASLREEDNTAACERSVRQIRIRDGVNSPFIFLLSNVVFSVIM